MTRKRFEFTIDVGVTAQEKGISVEEVIRGLEEARDARGSIPFDFKGASGALQVQIRYLEFHDGQRPLVPPDNRIRFCRIVAEEPETQTD